MIKVIIALTLMVALIMWACLKVASDADDQMEKFFEEDGK